MPLLATTYALNFGLDYVKDYYEQVTVGDLKGDAVASKWLIILCCALKPVVTWNANEVSLTCRERCGGQGPQRPPTKNTTRADKRASVPSSFAFSPS
jgi:acyl-CoA oxidase